MSYWRKLKAKVSVFIQILIIDHRDKITELAIILHIIVITWPILPHGRIYPTIPYTWCPWSGLSLIKILNDHILRTWK